MIELTRGRPQMFSVNVEPPRLLRFAYGGDGLRPFSVPSLDASPLASLERGRGERIVWISDSGDPPQDVAMPDDTPAGEDDIPISSDDAGLLATATIPRNGGRGGAASCGAARRSAHG